MTDGMAGLDEVFRAEWGRLVAVLMGRFRDLDLAEDSAQEAFTAAAARWPHDGVPANPQAWLVTTAHRRALDRLRREHTLAAKTALLAAAATPATAVTAVTAVPNDGVTDDSGTAGGGTDVTGGEIPDERLELVFTCCHPALTVESQVALVLRAVAGLTTAQIAHAFLVPEATMAQRLSRARRKIRVAGIPFRVPPADLLPERLAAVLAVVYLVFTEGHGGRSGLATEAIRLGGALAELLPHEPEVHGLLALMVLHEARRAARLDADGEVVLLADQDRSRWDRAALDAGRTSLDRALALHGRGPYVVQAAIAALHAEPVTDWPQVLALYGELLRLTGSPVVALQRAVALAEVDGPQVALAAVDRLQLPTYRWFHATRADLLRRLGRTAEAEAAYRAALALTTEPADQRFLRRRLGALAERGT